MLLSNYTYRHFLTLLWLWVLIVLSAAGYCQAFPAEGSCFPELSLNAPDSRAERRYLGITDSATFDLRDMDCPLVLVEILGVYCPQCHAQAPLFNNLYKMIQNDPKLSCSVKMLGIAIGATPLEIEYLKEQFEIPFPVVSDPKFEAHKSLGEPRTPLTIIIADDGTVRFAHLGVIEDIEKLFVDIKGLEQ